MWFQLALFWSTNFPKDCAVNYLQPAIALVTLEAFRNSRTVAAREHSAAKMDGRTLRVTLSYMKTSTITIRLDDALGRELDQACARTGRTRSDLARDALRRQLALLRFERLRRRVLPLAESQGYLTDDDVFRDVS